jgi:hypothetical protein
MTGRKKEPAYLQALMIFSPISFPYASALRLHWKRKIP